MKKNYVGAIDNAFETMRDLNKRCPWVASYYTTFFKNNIERKQHISKQFETKNEAIDFICKRVVEKRHIKMTGLYVFRIDGRSKQTTVNDEMIEKYRLNVLKNQ